MFARHSAFRRIQLLIAMFTLLGLGAGVSRAQTSAPNLTARLQSELSQLVVGQPAQAHPVRVNGSRPTYHMEGPKARPARAYAPGGLPLSLADQRDAKGGQRLTLSASSGTPGKTVGLIGRGYAPGQRVDLFWDTTNITQRQFVQADAAGRFTFQLHIPSAVDGAHTIAALEAEAAHSVSLSSVAVAQQRQSAAHFTVVGGLPAGSIAPSLQAAPVRVPVVNGPQIAAAPQAVKPWTFAVYIAGDNNLSTYANININQMIKAGGTNANVNVVLLLDQQNAPTEYDEVTGGGLVKRTPSTVNGNLNTGSPQTFIDFMGWVGQNYPAEHYATVIWNHGGGWTGIESDDPTGNTWTMADLRAALSGGLQRLGRPQYDALLFDACLMAQYEVALEIKDYVNVLIASEETVPGAGTAYDAYLAQTLEGNPNTTADSLGTAIVDTYQALYANDANAKSFTMSELKLEQPFDTVQARIDAFANALLTVGPTAAGDIQRAHDASHSYTYATFVDLVDFATQVKARINDANVQTTANALIDSLTLGNGFLLREVHGTASTGSYGLSVYLPAPNNESGYNAKYDQLTVQGSAWHTFAKAFYTGQYPGGAPPDEQVPTPPPPASASTSDIVYTARVAPTQFDLNRIAAVASPDQDAPTLTMLSDGFRNTYPRWSPDGSLVVYTSNRNEDAAAETGYELNLFMVKADGTPVNGATGPLQLTHSAVTCPDGPGAGTQCTVEQAYDPSWVTDGSGVIYSQLSYDLSNYPAVGKKQSIRLIAVANDQLSDTQILPGAGLDDDILFSNADFNGSLLVFRYEAPAGYNATFQANNIGIVDFSVSPPLLSYLPLNTAADVTSGNYVATNYPTFRPGTNDLAFLYTRVGDPDALHDVDPRPAPAAGEFENPYDTYDIGHLAITSQNGNYSYTMRTPIWTFENAQDGEGANFRPSWQPNGSGNMTASYSTDGGYTYNVGLFLNAADENTTDDRGFLITSDGYSYLPSWGTVIAANVQARVEIKPGYLEPGPNSNYYVSGAGFAAGEQVQLERDGTAIGTVQADNTGAFEVPFNLQAGTAPGSIRFVAKGASGKVSNEGVLVVLAPRNGNGTFKRTIYLPVVIR